MRRRFPSSNWRCFVSNGATTQSSGEKIAEVKEIFGTVHKASGDYRQRQRRHGSIRDTASDPGATDVTGYDSPGQPVAVNAGYESVD